MVTQESALPEHVRPGPGSAGFDAFVAARSRALLRRARLLTGNDAAAAEDLVQHALIEVWRRWDRVAEMEHVEAYVRTVLLRRFLKDKDRSPTPIGSAVATSELTGSVVAPTEPAGLDLIHAVRRLPRMQRAVILLRYYDDLSEAETAATLGISVGSVKSHTSRAMGKLRELLPGYGGAS